jgi:hypothetical protein
MNLDNFQKDIANLGAGLAEGLVRLQYGSYSERHPTLGRMLTCPLCHRRRRQMPDAPCCTSTYLVTHDSWAGRDMRRKLRHRRHSNELLHQVHDMGIALQDENFRHATQSLVEGMPPFHRPSKKIGLADIPAFAEKVVLHARKKLAHAKRKQQQTARRINFGLIP